MHVILAATPYAGWEALRPLLTHLGLTPPESFAVSRWQAALPAAGASSEHHTSADFSLSAPPDQSTPYAELLASCDAPGLIDMSAQVNRVEQWLEVADDTCLMLFHCRPEIALDKALTAGELPSAALDGWRSVAERLLSVVRRHRNRTLVVDVEAALVAPNLFLEAVKRRLDLAVPPWKEGLQLPEAPGDDLQRIVAAQCVAQRYEVRALLGELEASSLAIGEPITPPAPDCDGAWLKAQNVEPPQSDQDSDRLRSELDDAREENELLLTQLHQVQEELERFYLQTQDLKKKAKDRKAETALQEARNRIARMEKTLSWRITAPLRWGFKPFKRGLKGSGG